MEIRKIEVREFEEFWKLRLKALKEHPESFESDYEESLQKPIEEVKSGFEKALASNESFVVGAFAEGKLVGNVCFRRQFKKKINHKGYVWGMYVLPQLRGNGVAKALLLKIIEYIKEFREILQINVNVEASNEPAVRLYESLEFEEFGYEKRAINVEGKFVDNIHMMRYL